MHNSRCVNDFHSTGKKGKQALNPDIAITDKTRKNFMTTMLSKEINAAT